jgi:hypothetical protein
VFFWQVTDGAVDSWPVLAKMEDAEDWDRHEMTATEFLYRILTDPRSGPTPWPSTCPSRSSSLPEQPVTERRDLL